MNHQITQRDYQPQYHQQQQHLQQQDDMAQSISQSSSLVRSASKQSISSYSTMPPGPDPTQMPSDNKHRQYPPLLRHCHTESELYNNNHYQSYGSEMVQQRRQSDTGHYDDTRSIISDYRHTPSNYRPPSTASMIRQQPPDLARHAGMGRTRSRVSSLIL